MNLYDMDNIGLKNHLLSNMQLIKRSDVRDVLMSPEKHYAFVWFVQELDDYSYISDDDMVKRILNDDRVNDKMNAILTSCKDISVFLNNENVLKFIFSKSLSSYFYSLDYNSSIPVINYMLSNNFEQYFSYFAPKIQIALLNDKEILNGILNSKYLRNILLNSTPDVFNVLIMHEKTRNVVFNLKISDINVLVKQDIYFPLDVSLDLQFKNIFLDVTDVVKVNIKM